MKPIPILIFNRTHFIYLGLGLAIGLFFGLFVFFPNYQKMARLDREIGGMQRRFAEQKRLLPRYGQLLKEKLALERTLSIDLPAPPAHRLLSIPPPQAAAELRQMARERDLAIKQSPMEIRKDGETAGQMIVNISAQCRAKQDFSALRPFLEALFSKAYVDGLELLRVKTVKSRRQVNMRIRLAPVPPERFARQ